MARIPCPGPLRQAGQEHNADRRLTKLAEGQLNRQAVSPLSL
jgi:hypothetical protein